MEGHGVLIEGNIIQGAIMPKKKSDYRSIGEGLFDTFGKEPDYVAQIDSDTDEKTTFREIKDKSVRCALWMKNQGISEDDIVVTCSHNHLDVCIPFYAVFMIEAVHTAWDHEINENAARQLMKFYKPKIIFASEGAVDVLQKAAELEHHEVKLIVFGSHPQAQSLNEIMQQQSESDVENFVPRTEKDPQKVAAILLTSGSTGTPKGVMYSSESLVVNMITNFRVDTVFLSYSTLMWVTGFALLFVSVFIRMRRIVSHKFDPEDLCRIIEKYKVNSVFLTFTKLAELVKFEGIGKYNLQSLQEMSTGGARSPKKLLDKLKNKFPNVNIVQYYGITENGGGSVRPIKNPSNYDSLGSVAMNAQIKIIDPISKEALGPNEPGELCLKRPNMMIGYYKNPEATKEVIDAEGWLHSGDLCYYNENREFFFVDRLKELMKFQNHQITPGELEQVLSSHPAVMDVAVVPIPHEIDGEWPMAFVKTVPGKKVTEEELVKLSLGLGEKKKLRGGVKFMDDLPKTATGKTARAELKRLAKSYGDPNSK